MRLPEPRGDLSAAVISALSATGGRHPDARTADPYGEDLQLALYVLYELHYQGFDAIDPDLEWDPGLLRQRASMEKVFLDAMRSDVTGGDDIGGVLETLLVEPVDGQGIGHFLCDHGDWWHVREYFVHRSVYHHKEADPHAWVIPRLRGQAKAALVAVEFDEFGGGRGERMHSRLYADLLTGAGLHPGYLHYLDQVPAQMLAVVNMMSLFGLHRSLRGALVGHFAAAEITTPPSARRMIKALRRLGADPECVRFFSEHVEADAVHEQVMRRDVIGDLLTREPELTESVVFGVQATEFLEDRFGEHVLGAWRAGRSSLRQTCGVC